MEFYSGLGFLILFATIGGALAIRFKQPAVLGLLVMGAIVGPHYLALVPDSEMLTAFADIGAVLLLFTIGIEFNVNKLSKLGTRVFLIALFKLGIVFLLSYELGSIFGIFSELGSLGPLYLGAILSITSTAIVVRILEQKEMINRKEVPILVAMLIVEDLFAIFALTVFSGTNAGHSPTSINLLLSIITALAILSAVYLVMLRLLRIVFDWLVKYQAGETMVLTALSLGVGMSYLAQAEPLNLTPSIGAFLAGSLVASLPKGEELERAISPFALVFSSLFFISVGMVVDLKSIGQYWQLIAVISIANIIFKFAGTSVSAYLFGFSSKSAVFSGLAMLSVGEFSLLIAREGSKVAGSFDLLGITSAVVLISSITTSVTIGKYEWFHGVTSNLMPNALKRRGRRFSEHMRVIIETLEQPGRFSAALGRASASMLDNAGIIGLFMGVISIGWYLFSEYSVKILGAEVNIFGAITAIVAIIIAYLVYRLAKFFLVEYNLVRLSLLSKHPHEFAASHLASDFLKLILVLILFIASPFLFSVLDVPPYISRIMVVFIFLVLIWRFMDLIGFERGKSDRNQVFFKE
ncbi:MAG: cation:proton antiporter [Candidatus Micrarchaeota archaeon]